MRASLKWKFSGFLAVLLVFVVAILSGLILRGISSYQRQQTEAAMEQQAEAASNRIHQQYVTGTKVDPATFMRLRGSELARELGAVSGMRIILYDAQGVEVGDSLAMAEKSNVQDALAYALQNKIAYLTEGDMLEYLSPIQEAGGQLGVVHFQTSLSAQHAFYRNMLQLCWISGIVVLGISFVLGWLYMNRQANAIHRLKGAADRIREGQYLAEPSLHRQDELGELSLGIFEMSDAIRSNISSLQDEQGKLRLALDKLQQLEQQQKAFIHNISHEFKTPLTSIRAYSDLLQMYGDDPALIQEAQAAISKEATRLYELVERVLQLALLEKYAFEHHPTAVEVKELLNEICSRMKGKADQFGIVIEQELEPAWTWADRENLTHMFINLVDNAIKYNVENGSVTITNRMVQDQVEIEFRDTGIGIPVDRRDQIFEPFYTVNQDRARQSGGSGLGLALVKQLAEQQRGTIRVESPIDGQGTIFIVTLPLDILPHQSLQVGNKSKSSG
jgi:signal transduction histidine kinase